MGDREGDAHAQLVWRWARSVLVRQGVVITGETVVGDLICCEGEDGTEELIAGAVGEEAEGGDRD